jgi:hypothetical protein
MPSIALRLLCGVATLFLLALLAPGCADNDVCRYEPERCSDGEAGAFCQTDQDCRGICCKDQANCASGMCTYPCKDDVDCPADMACEHDLCFYRCQHDDECAIGQKCEHGNTVCEWP